MQIPFFLVLVLAALLLGLLFGLTFIWNKLNQRISELEAQVQEKSVLTHRLFKEIEHFQNTSLQLSQSVADNQQVLSALKQQVTDELAIFSQQLADAEPSDINDKLYRRAFKLVEKGADVDELIEECELPRAEAEMLLAIHRRSN